MNLICLTGWIKYSIANDNNRVVVKKGQKVPFDGILLTNESLAKLVTKFEKQKEILQIELDFLKKVQQYKLDSEKSILEAKLNAEISKRNALSDDFLRQKKLYEKMVVKSIPWYKSRYLAFILGVVTGTTGVIMVYKYK